MKVIRSDNGTNFVGARKELQKEIDMWNQQKITDHMLQHNVEWKFNPPGASHFGGIWERQIRTIRKLMMALTKEQTLSDEGLLTLLCEIEAIINSRPLTVVSQDAQDVEALAPNHLLHLKGKPLLPPRISQETDKFRRRWKQVQYIADIFWKRWTKEYMVQLQERQKWLRLKENIKIGDIVLIIDGSKPRNVWPMGRVTATLPDKHGVVRQAEVKTRSTTLLQPVAKLCMLLEGEYPEQHNQEQSN